ncbi:MAG: hypothetical protein HY563_02025 [Ignavibacteriales bacterium]|nr:hypothetical protein [Ignavibacteriales bacterium]
MKGQKLLAMLVGGDLRSIGRSDEAAAEVLANPLLFQYLVKGMLSSDPVLRIRSADAAEKVTAHNPVVLVPHKKKILAVLSRADQKEVRWHVAQIIPRLALNSSERKVAAGILSGYLDDSSSIVRTCAMQSLAQIALTDSRLRVSITKTIAKLAESGTPAMKARGRKLLVLLKKKP